MSTVTPLRPLDLTPPRNLEAESGLLGAIILNNAAHDRVSRFLLPKHFSDPANGMIYQAMTDLLDQGSVVDPVTLKAFCDRDDEMVKIGGMAYIARLAGGAANPLNAEHYGRTILECYERRVIIAAGERAALRARSTVSVEFIKEELADALREEETRVGAPQMIGHVTNENVQLTDRAMKGQAPVVATGYTDLDDILGGGLEPEQLVILGARPSMGKTALGLGIAERVALAGGVVAFSSLEMNTAALNRRVIAGRMRISPKGLKMPDKRDGTLINRMVAAGADISGLKIIVDDTPAQSVAHVRSFVRQVKAKHKRLDLIVIDHISLMSASPGTEGHGRYEKMTEISGGLKALAKQSKAPVLALCQLSRAVEGRDENRPRLSDLRDSGAIEQDADIVAFLYRDAYYTDRKGGGATYSALRDRAAQAGHEADKRNIAELSIAKQRDGKTGRIELHFDEERIRFDNLERR